MQQKIYSDQKSLHETMTMHKLVVGKNANMKNRMSDGEKVYHVVECKSI
jgi:hypothetical protein